MINSLRGMKDLFDDDAKLFKYIIQTCEEVAKNFSYNYCETPKLEELGLFKRSVGESSDIVGKEMYEFKDKSGIDVCLRPEGTAGVVRAFIQNKFDKAGGVKKFYYYGSMFRYERPQKGRLREFHQFGVECFGEQSVYEDASVILMAKAILDKLGIKSTLKLNSLGDKECMPKYKEKLVNFIKPKQDKFCEDCQRRLATNPIRILDCKNDNCQKELENVPIITENLNEESKRDFDKLKEILNSRGIEFELDSRLVRGLDYYTKTAFEFQSDEIGSKSAIIGGGRYDALVEDLGGKQTFGIGWAMGIERIMEILKLKNLEEERKGIYICSLDDKYLDEIYKIGLDLRQEFQVDISYESKKMAKHLNIADKKNAEIFLCIGENEFNNNEIFYKNLKTNEQKTIKLNDLKGIL